MIEVNAQTTLQIRVLEHRRQLLRDNVPLNTQELEISPHEYGEFITDASLYAVGTVMAARDEGHGFPLYGIRIVPPGAYFNTCAYCDTYTLDANWERMEDAGQRCPKCGAPRKQHTP